MEIHNTLDRMLLRTERILLRTEGIAKRIKYLKIDINITKWFLISLLILSYIIHWTFIRTCCMKTDKAYERMMYNIEAKSTLIQQEIKGDYK